MQRYAGARWISPPGDSDLIPEPILWQGLQNQKTRQLVELTG